MFPKHVILSINAWERGMATLTRASEELFRRPPDERFESLQTLFVHCAKQRELSRDIWKAPRELSLDGGLMMNMGTDGAFLMNDWSFTQLCKTAGVARDTINRLSRKTASAVFEETLPRGEKPMQILVQDETVRALHGTQYTRLWNADLVHVLTEFAVDFEPPQQGMNGATGLYAGEQDLFCFLIDPKGWTEIDGEAFAPGFFLWNSEVGRRSLGIQTFWFQAVCQNHIVWDATEVVEWTRKHTASVHEGLSEIRTIIEGLVEKRDARKDGFWRVVKKAMETKLGSDAEEAFKALTKHGIGRGIAKDALEIARTQGRFTIWTFVDALTRKARDCENAGDRTDADQKAASLLELVQV